MGLISHQRLPSRQRSWRVWKAQGGQCSWDSVSEGRHRDTSREIRGQISLVLVNPARSLGNSVVRRRYFLSYLPYQTEKCPCFVPNSQGTTEQMAFRPRVALSTHLPMISSHTVLSREKNAEAGRRGENEKKVLKRGHLPFGTRKGWGNLLQSCLPVSDPAPKRCVWLGKNLPSHHDLFACLMKINDGVSPTSKESLKQLWITSIIHTARPLKQKSKIENHTTWGRNRFRKPRLV